MTKEIFTAVADMEITPDGSRVHDGVSIMRIGERESPFYGQLIRQANDEPQKSAVVHMTLEQAKNLLIDLQAVITHSETAIKGKK